jgi:hypothetical protein
MYRMDAGNIRSGYVRLSFINDTINLPIWIGYGGCIFLSLVDTWHYLGVSPRLGKLSQWLALDVIPKEMLVEGQFPDPGEPPVVE